MSEVKYVVGIGASAGGLEAIQQLFDNLPDTTGMSFVIIQHLSPNFKSLMPELLSKHTHMKIYTAKSNQVIKPNCIYLNDRNSNLVIKNHKFVQEKKNQLIPLNLPIDLFFHSLASEFNDKAIAVILSGTGTDGSRGIKSIKEASGMIVVQDPKSAQFDGMPNAAISTRLVDYILPPDKIAKELVDLAGKTSIISNQIVEITDNLENELNDILEEIFKLTGIDFRQYKRNTLIRRLDKRMMINKINSIKAYRSFLQSNPDEKETLKKDFLIGVTSFFRDTEAFTLLTNKVIGDLLLNKAEDETLRIWVAGCATGEEAYSIAILLMEHLQKNNLVADFKIFATDIDIASLKTAGAGLYPLNIANDLPKDILDRYFTKIGENFKISKKIREKIVFSYHNILKDPPFVRLDMISCRNLLIYLNNNAQQRILLNFQFALKLDGYLFLGSSESMGGLQKYFRVIHSKWKIFKNITEQKALPGFSTTIDRSGIISQDNHILSLRRSITPEFENVDYAFYKVISDLYAPSCLIVDDEYNLLFMLGEMKKYLSFPDGVFENNLLNLVPDEMRSVIRNGIRSTTPETPHFEIKKVKFEQNGEIFELSLVFRIIKKNRSMHSLYLVEFSDEKKISKVTKEKVPGYDYDDSARQRIMELENELKYTKNELQNVIEELETSNEELQSSNEELLASNEELQSTNEELQSVNEELHTVNSELQDRNEELFVLNADMNNLLNSTDIATLFLDSNLHIRKFTPALKKHFNLRDSDIGRPIKIFATNFDEETRQMIIDDCWSVLEKSIVYEKEIVDQDGNNYLKRISPFMTPDRNTEGDIITLTNTNILKKTQKELEYRKNLLTNVIRYLPGATVFLFDRELNLLMAEGQELDKRFIEADESDEIQINGYERSDGKSRSLKARFQKAFEKQEKSTFEVKVSGKDYFINAIPIKSNNGKAEESLLVLAVDATEIKRAEAEVLKLNQAIFQAPSPIVLTNTAGEITYVNPRFREVTGYAAEETIGKSTNLLKSGTHDESFYKDLWKTIKSGKTWKGEFLNRKKTGTNYWELASISPLKNKKGEITGYVKVSEDVTERKMMEKELKEAKEKAEIANIYKNNFLANMSHEIRTPMNGIIGFSNLLKDEHISESDREKYVKIIHGNSMQLLNLIDDIIDISKIEAGELKIVQGECHLNQTMNELNLMFQHEKNFKDKKGLKLELEIPEVKKDIVVKTDPIRLKQILTNLLSNAIKFTAIGYVKFGYRLVEDKIRFYVKDTGMGIATDKLDAIFERFEQSDIELSKKYGGTGLGLTISKGLVSLLGGNIWVESEKGLGAEFTFEIPFVSVRNPKIKQRNIFPVSGSQLSGIKLLIVEDDDIIFEFLKIVLKPYKLKIKRATHGKTAIGYFKKGERFDLILMDLGLPDTDGYSVTREVLKIHNGAKIIAQSAYAMQNDIEKSYDAGCIDYISKPISAELLISKMSSALDKVM